MKLIKRKDSDYYWSKFLTLVDLSLKYDKNSEDWNKVNKAGWEMFGLWQKEFTKEFKKGKK